MKTHLFIPCLVDQFLPEVGLATADCLSAAGCEVAYPSKQTCCGQMFLNSGMPGDAAGLARAFVRRFADATWVVAPSWSCVDMVRTRYGELLEGRELEQWESLRERVFELTEFLSLKLGLDAWQGSFRARAILHWSCHMPRDGNEQDRLEGLLGGVDGLELLPRPPFECCGFGGVFWNLWSEVSASIGRRRLDVLTRDGPDAILLAEPGCLMQMQAAASESKSGVRVLHVAQLLAEAIR
ncbi:MAG: (Fe-S)-binding protein [Deltaproteobacteria bacterium]|nr:(Fe-S)-binding protein [Deltaproteobacteria bacterium]